MAGAALRLRRCNEGGFEALDDLFEIWKTFTTSKCWPPLGLHWF
jgi:hypothetical protein